MPALPAHASPVLAPMAPAYETSHTGTIASDDDLLRPRTKTPPPILTPNLTPPRFTTSPVHLDSPLATSPQAEQPIPRLVPVLPNVSCQVRARIPTTVGQEMWLHLYHNDADDKEHLAIVFGPNIRSKTLDAPRPGETEKDRMIRGAYTGRLYPGRTDSRVSAPRPDVEAASSHAHPPVAEIQGSASEAANTTAPLVRIHSECYTGETVWSARCDCGEQLDQAARLMSEAPLAPARPTSISSPIAHETARSLPQTPSQTTNSDHNSDITGSGGSGGGVIIYLRQEGRGIGLLSKLKAYNLQDLGHDTVMANLLLRHPADARSYGLATAMLLDLGLGGSRGIRLLTNNPDKVRAVEGPNREVRVLQRVPMIPLAWSSGGATGVQGPEIERYLSTKVRAFLVASTPFMGLCFVLA